MSTWVFLRGLTRDKRHWGGFPLIFAEHVPGARVVCLDLPGNGELHRARSCLRIEDMPAQCRSELQRRGVAPPYFLFGLSMGAMLASAWAVDHPDEVLGCVMINTSLGKFSPFHRRLQPQSWHRLLRIALSSNNARKQEGLVFDMTSTRADLREQTVERWARYRIQYPVSKDNALRQLLAASRYRRTDRPTRRPMLLLASAGDRLVHHDCSARIAAAWDAPLRIHPSAGHDLPLDDGPWIAREVADWFVKQHASSEPPAVMNAS
jgi:pimeloyl-ACP methyl ester carboxylesterase